MSNQNKTDQRSEQRGKEGNPNSTDDRLPGMPSAREEGQPKGNSDDRTPKEDPNPGPGITSQGHRVDEDTPDHDNDSKQASMNKDMPTNEQPRDQDKDRKEPLDEQSEDEHSSKHDTKAKAL